MDELRVPKRRVEAQVSLASGECLDVGVFLADFAPGHSGAERLSDLLNGENEFVPAVDCKTDEVSIFNRRAISAVRVASTEEADDTEIPTIPTEHEVEVVLAGGTKLTGLIGYVRPPERSRLNDYLNEPRPFFVLREEAGLVFVNKHHVSRITPLKR